jgi:hypothetical protein
MTIRRQIECDIPGCGEKYLEPKSGDGWEGWGVLQGIALNGIDNPSLCPTHLASAAKFVDSIGKP